MCKNMLKTLFGVLFVLNASVAFAAEPEMDEETKKCMDVLEEANDELADVQRQAQITPASYNQNGQQQGTGNPMADAINKINEGNQKMAELQQKAAEQQRQLMNEEFKQLNEIDDKIHEFRKGDYKRRAEIKNAQTAKKRAEAEIRIKCNEQGENEYAALLKVNNELSARSRFESSNMGRMAGTNKRMREQQNYFVRRCLANAKTQEAFQIVQDEYDGKIHNFKIMQEEQLFDINHQESKIEKVQGHMAYQRRDLAANVEMQKAALKQSQTMNLIGLGMSLMTSSAGASDRQGAAATFVSADHVAQNWRVIEERCMAGGNQFFEVPSDLSYIFTKVNKACRRGGDQDCVRSSGRQSVPRQQTPTTTQSS